MKTCRRPACRKTGSRDGAESRTARTAHGANNQFITWSDNPGLVMSYFDATNLPEGLLAQG